MDRRLRSVPRDTRALMPLHTRLDPISAIAFVLLAIATYGLTRRRAVYGLVALILADPFEFARYVGPTTVTVPKIVLIGVAFALLDRRVSTAPLRGNDVRALLCSGIAIVLVTIATFVPGVYVDAVARESLKAVQYLSTFVIATLACAHDRDEVPLWYALGTIVSVVCASALVQELSGAPSAVMLAGHAIPRIAGLLEGPNQLAGFLDIAIPLCLARAATPGHRRFFAIVAFAVLTDVLTFSRAGVLAAAIGCFVVTLRVAQPAMRRTIAIAGGVFFALVAAVLARLHLATRFFSTDDIDTASGLGSRGELWTAALGFFRSHPLLGIGAGNFELELPDAGLIGVRTHANSVYLQSLAEGGIALFAATVFTIGAALRTFLVRAPREALFAGVGAATVALAVHQCFDFLTFFPKVGSFWWLWLGIAAGALVRARERS